MQMKINKHAVSKEAELETAIRDAYPKCIPTYIIEHWMRHCPRI